MIAGLDNRLVLITGAGASRRLGQDRPMPLIADWCDSLVDALDKVEPGLSGVLLLEKGMSGEAFERALGEFLGWWREFHLTERFVQVGRIDSSGTFSDVFRWIELAKQRVPRIVRAINESLWDEFGLHRVDVDAASNAYRELCRALKALPGEARTQLFSATTNYDRSGEAAWDAVGFRPDDGSRRRHVGGSHWLEVEQVQLWKPDNTVPHLHLHGAVGWYRDERRGVCVEPADQEFDDRRVPAVLYPDPIKDPLNQTDVDVHLLWGKLVDALREASHVLVLGHSLHDRSLVTALENAVTEKPLRLAVTFYSEDPNGSDGIQRAIEGSALAKNSTSTHAIDFSLVPFDFHAEADFAPLRRWIDGANIQKDGRAIGGKG